MLFCSLRSRASSTSIPESGEQIPASSRPIPGDSALFSGVAAPHDCRVLVQIPGTDLESTGIRAAPFVVLPPGFILHGRPSARANVRNSPFPGEQTLLDEMCGGAQTPLVFVVLPDGTITISIGASNGGTRNPLSSRVS